MSRRLVHRQETPEPVLEAIILKLWQVRIAEQVMWLELRAYPDPESKALVKEWHSMLSPRALEFLTLVLQDAEGVEHDIRTTPSANSGYKARASYAGTGTRKINKGRLVRYLQHRMGISQAKATNVVAELQDFANVIFEYTTG